MKNIKELYIFAKSQLAADGIEFPESEALRLCEHYFGISGRTGLTLHGGDIPSEDAVQSFRKAVSERKNRPLQYILGVWEFDSMELCVGEGVLIPREDTVALVETAERLAENIKNPRILDLCAGTGAVSLALARRIKDADIVCVELSDEVFPYLEKNIEKYGDGRVRALRADVLAGPQGELLGEKFDIIVSNPPYIPTADIETLSSDVKCEPSMALDGGDDGLDFYRVICGRWKELLKDGAALAVEIGFDQVEDVIRIFVRENMSNIGQNRDINGKIRVINGTFAL